MRTSKIGSGLVRATGSATRLPSRNVDGLEVLGHLGDLNGVETRRQEERMSSRGKGKKSGRRG